MFWKNSDNNTTGYVPPDPAICNTNRIIAIAFPTSPNTDTRVYTIDINTSTMIKPKTTNQMGSFIYTTRMNISHNVTLSDWKKPNVKKVGEQHKYYSYSIYIRYRLTS